METVCDNQMFIRPISKGNYCDVLSFWLQELHNLFISLNFQEVTQGYWGYMKIRSTQIKTTTITWIQHTIHPSQYIYGKIGQTEYINFIQLLNKMNSESMKTLTTTAQQIGKLQKSIMKAFMILIMSYTERWIALAKYIVSLYSLIHSITINGAYNA